MNDIEDIVRRTLENRARQASTSDHLLDDVHSKIESRRSAQRWLVPIAASALTAAVVLVVTTYGLDLWDGQVATDTATTATATPTSEASQSARALKCRVAPGLGNRTFTPDQPQDVAVTEGRRLLLRGVDGFCQRTVTFNGKQVSPILRSDRPFTGADWLRASAPGVVTVAVFQPMCIGVDDPQCFGGLSPLGTVRVTVVPKTPVEPITRICTRGDVAFATAGAAAVTAAERLGVSVRLRASTACRLDAEASVEVVDHSGATVQMPDNPLGHLVRAPLREGRRVTVTWDWLEPFCGRQSPYRARFPLLGHVEHLHELGTPACPTDYGEPPTDPRGLRFHGIFHGVQVSR
jgi:hypothetical protein